MLTRTWLESLMQASTSSLQDLKISEVCLQMMPSWHWLISPHSLIYNKSWLFVHIGSLIWTKPRQNNNLKCHSGLWADNSITVYLSLLLGIFFYWISWSSTDPYLFFLVCCQLLLTAPFIDCPHAVLAVFCICPEKVVSTLWKWQFYLNFCFISIHYLFGTPTLFPCNTEYDFALCLGQ